jgi:hypothetical protein
VRYPASWTTEQVEQDGVWYRYFLAPPEGPKRMPGASVTLLSGPLGVSIDEYAKTYLAANTLVTSKAEQRQGASGRSYLFQSADGQKRYMLLLLGEAERVYGLYGQTSTDQFERQHPAFDEMAASLTLERPSEYPEVKEERSSFTLRVPKSWQKTRSLSGNGTQLVQFSSPPLAADKNRSTVHASLTVTVEPVGGDGSLQAFYDATRVRLGEPFRVLTHSPWQDGYVDLMHSESGMSAARIKRFYRARDHRGYSLAFEARADVFPRVSRWCDMIAATFRIGPEMSKP